MVGRCNGLVRVTRTDGRMDGRAAMMTREYFMFLFYVVNLHFKSPYNCLTKLAIYVLGICIHSHWQPFLHPFRFTSRYQVFVLELLLLCSQWNAYFIHCVDMCGHFYSSLMGFRGNCFKFLLARCCVIYFYSFLLLHKYLTQFNFLKRFCLATKLH